MGILQAIVENNATHRKVFRQEPYRTMFRRFFTPLTLVNQLALIVLLSTLIGVASMMISARLVNGVQNYSWPPSAMARSSSFTNFSSTG